VPRQTCQGLEMKMHDIQPTECECDARKPKLVPRGPKVGGGGGWPWEVFFRRGQLSPCPPASGSGKCCKFSQRGPGLCPRKFLFCFYLKITPERPNKSFQTAHNWASDNALYRHLFMLQTCTKPKESVTGQLADTPTRGLPTRGCRR